MENISISMLGKEEKNIKHVSIGDRFYNIISSPINAENEKNYLIELLHDTTEAKKIEDDLMKQKVRRRRYGGLGCKLI